jgi:TfoX/Sxy family transcriptional regulator of competence genes
MADDQELAAGVRAYLAGAGDIREVRMFGGIGFMLNGNMVAAASSRGLLLRVGKDRQAEALAQSGTRSMVMRGRVMEGYVYVDSPALRKKATQNGLRMAIAHVKTLPPKAKSKTKQRKEKRK